MGKVRRAFSFSAPRLRDDAIDCACLHDRGRQTIPIVFTTQGDPVKEGLVPGLNRPGGNATGVTFFGPPLVAKRLELLHQLVPKASSVAMLINPNNLLAEPEAQEAQTAALILGLQLFVVRATKESQFATAFQAMIEHRAGALYMGSVSFSTTGTTR
jgi:putative tryptophan/tyrosine transport system substrate-binding protein